MVLGKELESERYLITIEEKLNPSSDNTHEVALKTQENEVERSVGPLYQPGKRKRRVCILTVCVLYQDGVSCVGIHQVSMRL